MAGVNLQHLFKVVGEGNLEELKKIEATLTVPLASLVDETNFTPLHAAAMFGRTEVVKYLLERGLSPLAQTKTPLYTPVHSAAYGGHLETVRVLVEKEPQTKSIKNYRGETPADTARRTGQVDVVKFLTP
eukprot:TRINITY_DN2805_c0_g1_i1.p1 TRINITY_DN2805_c0_g1~~TRINITY_DN2805_c0_g1_i1.p1  ORF type:complete len:130 (-),score=35.18 TRINITY_DN2805_c0_g1_i1:41-430(-)